MHWFKGGNSFKSKLLFFCDFLPWSARIGRSVLKRVKPLWYFRWKNRPDFRSKPVFCQNESRGSRFHPNSFSFYAIPNFFLHRMAWVYKYLSSNTSGVSYKCVKMVSKCRHFTNFSSLLLVITNISLRGLQRRGVHDQPNEREGIPHQAGGH